MRMLSNASLSGMRMKGLSLLETVMVLVIAGVVVVAAVAAGQGILENRKAATAAAHLRMIIAAVQELTGGAPNYTGLTPRSLQPYLPGVMENGTGLHLAEQYNVEFGPGLAAATPTGAALVEVGQAGEVGATDATKNYGVLVEDIDSPEVCTRLVTEFGGGDRELLGIWLHRADATYAAAHGVRVIRSGAVTGTFADASGTAPVFAPATTTGAGWPFASASTPGWTTACDHLFDATGAEVNVRILFGFR